MTWLELPLFVAALLLYISCSVAFTLEFLRPAWRAPEDAGGECPEGCGPPGPGEGGYGASDNGSDRGGRGDRVRPVTSGWGFRLMAAAFVLHGLALGARCFVTRYAPMTNMYESLSFFAWCIVLVLGVVLYRMPLPFAGAFTSPVFVVLMLLAYRFSPDTIPTLVPALQSWLLPAHVMLAFLGEAWFVLGFAAAVMFLVKQSGTAQEAEGSDNAGDGTLRRRPLVSRLPSAEVLDGFSYRAISLGYPLFTLGALILGMVWANQAWGRYWGWDPKEVWALITFIVYSLYLHGRLRWGWKGRISALLAVVGFIVTMFTLFGVNLLLSGLHSYAGSG